MVRIRSAVPGDAPAIARFIAMAEGEMVPFLTGEPDPAKAEAKLAAWVASPVPNRYSIGNILAAELGGAVVGCMISFPADSQPALDSLILADVNARGMNLDRLFFEGAPGSYYLSTMGVDPACRGKGAGSALLSAALARGKAEGFVRASLLVARDKPRARALYERLGFSVLEEAVLGEFVYDRMVRDL